MNILQHVWFLEFLASRVNTPQEHLFPRAVISRFQSEHIKKKTKQHPQHFLELLSVGSTANIPEVCTEALGQLSHDGVALILDCTEGRQVAVVAQHSTGTGVAVQGPCRISSWCCPPPQPPWHLHEGLQLPQQRLHPWAGGVLGVQLGLGQAIGTESLTCLLGFP